MKTSVPKKNTKKSPKKQQQQQQQPTFGLISAWSQQQQEQQQSKSSDYSTNADQPQHHTLPSYSPLKSTTAKVNVKVTVCPEGALRVVPGLNSLMNAVYEAHTNGITDIFLLNGTHDEKGNIVNINIPISIIGESREHCVVMGGLYMYENREDDVNVSNLTLRDSMGNGVCGNWNGATIHLDNVSVENSGQNGVEVHGRERNTMKNCNVSHSKQSGLVVGDGGLMSMNGNGTTIHHNCTDGESVHYGVSTDRNGGSSFSSIHLASPLTIEMISMNNGGGGDYRGTIKTITLPSKTNKMSRVFNPETGKTKLCVTPGLNSLFNAVHEAEKYGITSIFLLNGTHDEQGEVVNININISIIGESREHCIVMGGLMMEGKKEDDVNISNLTLRESKGNGVCGYEGASMHLDNVSVENSEGCGVVVSGTNRSNTMTNCNVSHSKYSGLSVSDDGLMTIDGNATTIHHNCTDTGCMQWHGLSVDSSSSIHIASPLTKDMLSKNNEGGRNYNGYDGAGDDGTIKTI